MSENTKQSQYKSFSIICSIIFLVVKSSMVQGQPVSDKPNFIFIITDDQPYDYLGCTGNKVIKTPHLDKLAEEGILFSNAHVTSAICTPSRVSMFLSQYERKHGVNFNSGTSVSEGAWRNAYPNIMRDNGYYTAYIGKNHSPIGNGGYESEVIESSFDYWYAAHGHLGFYPKERHKIFNGAGNETQTELLEEALTEFLTGRYNLEGAKHLEIQRPLEKPFCLTLCLNLPHGASTSSMEQRPNDPEIYKTLYRDINIPLPDLYVPKESIEVPKLPPEILKVAERQDIYNYVDNPGTLTERYIRHLQASSGIDAMVGRMREQLVILGLDKNTVIIYTSDHGIMLGQFGLGGKALCYEQCTKVPLIIYNPFVKTRTLEVSCNELVQTIDIAPTILKTAGVEVPETYQGYDISSLIEGKKGPVRQYLFTENLWSTQFGNPRCEAVQTKEWKYIRYYRNDNLPASEKEKLAKELDMDVSKMLYCVHDPDIALYRMYCEAPFKGEKPVYEELYNLIEDPSETINLIDQEANREIRQELRQACVDEVVNAKGDGGYQVLRYTCDSKHELQTTTN